MFDHISFRKNGCKAAALSLFFVVSSWNGANAAAPVASVVDNKVPQLNSASADVSSSVVVKGFNLTGNTALKEVELQAVLAGYINQRCDLNKLRQAADKVTEAYRQQGNNLAKAYILPQNIVDGMVNITVVEGRIGNILIEGNRNYSSQFIRNYLTSGAEAGALTIDRLERGMLVLNSRFTDLKVTANFAPGVAPGTTDIHVKAVDSSPIHATLTTNNLGSNYVSRYRFGGQLEWTNAIIPGSALTVGGFVGDKLSRMHVVNGGYIFPVNSVGTQIGITVLDGNFEVGKDFAVLGIHNDEISSDVFISHPFTVNRKSTFSGKAGFKASNARFYLYDQLSDHDKGRSLYAQLQYDTFSLGGRSIADLTLSQGLGSLWGGTGSNDPLASRKNASNTFTRLNLNMARLQPLSDQFSTLLRLSGQWSNKSLLAGEEWLVGGEDSVHGYGAGEQSGDEGYLASFALRLSPLQNKESLRLSAFFDYGCAFKKSPQAGSYAKNELIGVGLGINSHLNTVAPTDFRLDVGWPINPSTNFLYEKPVVYFDTAIRF